MAFKKSSIELDLDHDSLLELRKILFRNGLGPQEFFAFIVERTALGDERIEALLHELSNIKSEVLTEGGVKKIKRKRINADSLYEAIEAQLKKDKENDLFEND